MQGVLTLFHGCFSRFLNCAHRTKWGNASHLGPWQTSMIEFFCDSSLHLKAVNYFCKKLHRR